MKVYRLYAAIFVCLLCLAGCQKDEAEQEASIEETTTLSDIDWKTGNFAAVGELKEEQGLWPAEYIKWEHEYDPELNLRSSSSQVFEDRIYQLNTFTTKDTGRRYLLEIYDTSSMQVTITEIDDKILGTDGSYIADMSVIDSGMYAFLVMKYERDEADALKLVQTDIVYTDLEKEIERVDLMPAIREKGMEDIYQKCLCDALGNIYLREVEENVVSNHLLVFDRNGSLWMDQSLEKNDEIASPFRTPEGNLIFPVNNRREKTARLVFFDSEEKEMRVLAKLEEESINQLCGVQGTELYYETYYGIVKWDLVSGDRTLVFSFEENSVPRVYSTMLVFRDGQTPVFRMYAEVSGRKEDWLMVLAGQEPEKAEPLQVVSLNGNQDSVKDCVALASRRNPGLSFTYKSCADKEREDFRTRIMAELVAGNGPDILYVSREDMRRLQDMGALANLDSFLTEEMKDRILPAIIELGTVDGAFVGIVPTLDNMVSVVTLKSIWEPDVWSLEDIIGLLDTGDFTGIFCQGTTSFAPEALLKWLTEFGLQESVLVDWETRESHFDGDLFLKILELARTYGSNNPYEADTWLGVGGCPGQPIGASIDSFNALYEEYGDEYHFVGWPTRGSSGNYLNSRGVLVVNRNTTNSEAVSAYLSCLLEDEIQYPYSILPKYSILKVSLEDIETVEITAEGFENETRFFWKDHRLLLKEDGTTTLQDHKDFLESCIPEPDDYEDIVNMVWEEAQSYMAGDKSAKEVARIVDSRIQLYLDEGNGR